MRILMLPAAAAAFLATMGLVTVPRAVADDRDICYRASGDEAISACSRAINSGRFRGHDLAVVYYNRCVEYHNKNDDTQAISDCSQAIRLDPKYADAYNNRGNYYKARGETDRAISDYNEAIRLKPNDPIPYNGRGNAYRAKHDNDRAIADYLASIRLKPGYSFPHNGLGNAYRDKGDNDRAMAEYYQSRSD